MALSGSVDFTLNRTELLETAFELAGVKDPGESLSSEDLTAGSRLLNMMIKALSADGLHLWKKDEGAIIPVVGRASYNLGPSGTDACLVSDLAQTTVSGEQTGVTTSVTVASTTGMAASDTVLIEVAGVLVSRTVSTVPTSTSFTVTSTLGSVTLADGAFVYAYTSKIERPNRVLDARRVSAGIETPINLVGREEYFQQPNKTTEAPPVSAHYDPKLTNGVLYLWPTFDTVRDYVTFTFERQLQDLDASTDNFDVPAEWLEPITYGLADRICTAYGQSTRKVLIAAEAARFKSAAMSFDREIGSISISPRLS